MVERIEQIKGDRLKRWSVYVATPFVWLALALLNPLLLIVPPMLVFAIWKAMEYGMVDRHDPVGRPRLLLGGLAASIAASSSWPGPASMLERCDPVAVGKIDAGVRVEEQSHDLLMSGAAVAEDHRFEQGRPAEVVDVVDVDVGLEECPHHLDVAAVGGWDQRGAAEAVGTGDIWLGAEDLAQHLHIAGLADGEECVRAGLVLEVDVGSRVHERADDRGRAGVRRCGDRRPVAFAAIVGRRSVVEQPKHLVQVASPGRARELARRRSIAFSRAAAEDESDERQQQPGSYSTVTVFARLRGWSTLRPRRRAIR